MVHEAKRRRVFVDTERHKKVQSEYLHELAMELLSFPYFTVQKETLIKEDSAKIKSTVLYVVAYMNPDKALNENCMYIRKGRRRMKVRFEPMHRYILHDGRPSLTPWEMHRPCSVEFVCGYIVVKLYAMRNPFQPSPGFIFDFRCDDIQEELAFQNNTKPRDLASIISEKIKVDLPRVSDTTDITNPTPFRRWPETRNDCETEEDQKNLELMRITKHEFDTLSKLVMPFPVIEGKRKGVQGDVLVLQRGGILPTNIQGSIPDKHLQLSFPECMFDMTKAFRMPPEVEESLPIPDKKKHPEEYKAYMLGGALVRGSKTERHPFAGRVLAPFVEDHEKHWDILKAHTGKNLDLKKIKFGDLSILVHWPLKFLKGKYSWDGCQEGRTRGYETKVFGLRKVPMSIAKTLGPVIFNKDLVRMEKELKEAGKPDEYYIQYAKIEENKFGDTSFVFVRLAPDETQYGLRFDVLPESTLENHKIKMRPCMIPPVAMSIVSPADRTKGCTFYLVDNDPRDIKVVASPPKEGEPVRTVAKKPVVAKPKIEVRNELKTFLGYGVERGIRIVSPNFIRDIPCSIPDGRFNIESITDVVDPRHFNQLAAVAIGQKRRFNEDINAFITQEEEEVVLSEREAYLACPVLNFKVNYMSKNYETKERAVMEWQRMDRKNKATLAYEQFKKDKAHPIAMSKEEWNRWSAGIFPRTRYVTTKKDSANNKKRRAKKGEADLGKIGKLDKPPVFESEGFSRPRNFLQYTAWKFSKHVRAGMQSFMFNTPAAFTAYRRLKLPNPVPFAERAAHARKWLKEGGNLYKHRPVDG